jgi:hypothetical protein
MGRTSSGSPGSVTPDGLMAALIRIIARHPVVAFMVIGLGAGS